MWLAAATALRYHGDGNGVRRCLLRRNENGGIGRNFPVFRASIVWRRFENGQGSSSARGATVPRCGPLRIVSLPTLGVFKLRHASSRRGLRETSKNKRRHSPHFDTASDDNRIHFIDT